MRDAIHALKYDRIRPAARRLGAMLASAMTQLFADAPGELLVVPVPLHRSRRQQRGFNQARVLAGFAIKILRKSHPAWRLTLAPATLMRLRPTESQAGLTPRQRRQNVRGVFKVSNPSAVRGRQVLLVDDILTTGATARAAAQSLIKAGAASVYVVTLARARRSNVSTEVPMRGSLSTWGGNSAQLHHTQPGARPAISGTFSSSSIYQPSS
jgi:ComF family protein